MGNQRKKERGTEGGEGEKDTPFSYCCLYHTESEPAFWGCCCWPPPWLNICSKNWNWARAGRTRRRVAKRRDSGDGMLVFIVFLSPSLEFVWIRFRNVWSWVWICLSARAFKRNMFSVICVGIDRYKCQLVQDRAERASPELNARTRLLQSPPKSCTSHEFFLFDPVKLHPAPTTSVSAPLFSPKGQIQKNTDKMHLMYTLDNQGKRVYTLKKVVGAEVTKSAHPARFSPDDKYSR